MDPNNTSNLPYPTIDEIEEVMKQLISEDGETTTLQVKLELRSKGFWVSQNEVSDACNEIYRSNQTTYSLRIDYDHRIYSFLTIATPTTQAVNQAKAKAYPDAEETATPVSGDWEVVGFKGKMFIKGGTSRNKARAYLAKRNGEVYFNVAAVRVK
jgi:hypothetical protein